MYYIVMEEIHGAQDGMQRLRGRNIELVPAFGDRLALRDPVIARGRVGGSRVEDLPLEPLVLTEGQRRVDIENHGQVDQVGETGALDLALLELA